MNKLNIKAVIFDLDGTVTDTEKYYQMFWPKALEHYGYKISKSRCLKLRSYGRPYVIKQLQSWYGQDFPYHDIKALRIKLMDKYLLNKKIDIKPGIKQCLIYLKKNNILTAIATAGNIDRTKALLKKVGLYKYFNKYISATDVKHGKPAPDIYLYTVKQLKLKPKDCLAIEDSPNGVMSAYKAGINTIMIPDLTKPDKSLSKLNITVLKDGYELIQYIKKNK